MSDFKKFCIDEKLSPVQIVGARKAWNHQQAIIDEHTEVIKLQDADLRKYEKQIESLKTQLAVYKDDMRKDAEKIGELQNRIHDAELQIAVHWGADEDTDSVLRDVEKALRGAND